ncbi:MAG: hypothetical protein HY904_14205 [Deltaproteobacteria bacterium]|nr:hypothetical protein [Deltaproteobacteria bacterium]
MAGARFRLFLLGACTTAFQVLFSRAFLTSFAGNEAVLSTLLAAWLLTVAAGAAAAHRAGAGRAGTALALLGPTAVLAWVGARLLPMLFPAGAAGGPWAAFAYALVLLMLPCASSGYAFARAAVPAGGGTAYAVESLGSAAAGALLGVVLLGQVPDAALLGVIPLLAAWGAVEGDSRARDLARVTPGLLAAVACAVLPVGAWPLRQQGPHLVAPVEAASAHGSVVVDRGGGELAVYVDRRPVLTGADAVTVEETVGVPLALHPAPRRVLVVGVPPPGAAVLAKGLGAEAVAFMVEDPVVAGILRAGGLQDAPPGVEVRVLDGEDPRVFLRRHAASWDVVLLLTEEPAHAGLNRFFTQEWFDVVKRALAPGGLAAVLLPGHAEFASREQRRLHSSVARTLDAVFPAVRVLPLSRTLYVAAEAPLPAAVDLVAAITDAFAARGVVPLHLGRAQLEDALSARRLADAARWSALAEPVNRDAFPTAYRLALERTVAELGGLPVEALGVLALALLVGLVLVAGPRRNATMVAVATSGGAGMALQLLVLLACQSASGALHRELALLVAGFLLGAAGGAAAGRRPNARAFVIAMDLGVALVALALAWILPAALANAALPRAAAFLLAAACGAFPGAQFAAAAREGAGRLYAADLVGAAVAALATFTVVVPLLGIAGTCALVAGVKAVTTALLLAPPVVDEPARRRSALALPLLFGAFIGVVAGDASHLPVYAFTFTRAYQLAAAALLIAVLVFPLTPNRAWQPIADFLRERWRLSPARLILFTGLLPMAAFPVGRCYFHVPFIFCHTCPRPCVFGVLRPYLVPVALLANLHDHRFCERACPLGTLQASCEDATGARARRLPWLAWVRWTALGLVALAYLLAPQGHVAGQPASGMYAAFFRNTYAPSLGVLLVAAVLLLASFRVRRPFCEALCPIGAVGAVTGRVERVLLERARSHA